MFIGGDKMMKEDAFFSKKSQGRKVYLDYLDGKFIGKARAILAKCFECCNGYADGRTDCGVESCPLYPYMPYRKKHLPVYDDRPKRKISDKQKERMMATRKKL